MLSLILFRRNQFIANKLNPETWWINYLHFEVCPPNVRRFSSNKVASFDSFTISYLVNSCGLSTKDAEKASKLVSFSSNPENPNKVLTFLKNHGFSQKQIAYIAKTNPNLFISNVEKTILPKFEFFASVGIPANFVASKVCFDPNLLRRSLEKSIIPSFNFLKYLLDSEERVASMFKKRSWFFSCLTKGGPVASNIMLLLKMGVPRRFISLLVCNFPEVLARSSAEFRSVVDEVLALRFDVSKSTFVFALHCRMGKSNRKTWDRCYSLYKEWGCSEDDIQIAIQRFPNCMIMSENNIMKTMEYFVNKMGLPASIIAQSPWALSCSLEKRVMPRYSVIKILILKGFLKKDVSLRYLFPSEKDFLEKYVKRYEKQLPNLLALYQDNLHVPDP